MTAPAGDGPRTDTAERDLTLRERLAVALAVHAPLLPTPYATAGALLADGGPLAAYLNCSGCSMPDGRHWDTCPNRNDGRPSR